MDAVKNNKEDQELLDNDFTDILKAFLYSFIGICIFFLPIKIDGQTRTLLYHIAFKIQDNMKGFLQICIVIYMILGIVKALKKEKNEKVIKIFIFLRIISLIIILNIFYGSKSFIFLSENAAQLIDELVINIATILPLSSIFMPFILEYGFLDIVESYFHNIMKKIFKMSGKTLVNILVYIYTDCFCGYFMTNKLYRCGKLRESEACILVLNFSILSFQMISYLCNELNITKLEFIFTSTSILILTNMILCRIYPISKKKKSYFIKTNYRETIHRKNKFKKGVKKYIQNKNKASIFKHIIDNLEEAFNVVIDLIPNIIIILFLSDILVNNVLIIDILKITLYPFMDMLKLHGIDEINKFIVTTFFNDILAVDNVSEGIGYTARFVICIIATLKCTSLSGNMIYMKSAIVPVCKKDFLIVYIERIMLILAIYSLGYYFYIGYIT